jgi:hypothetical protein
MQRNETQKINYIRADYYPKFCIRTELLLLQ